MTRVPAPPLKKTLSWGIAAAVVVAALVAAVTDQGVLQATVLGLGTGALIAAIGLGVVVTFRGSGVINMAGGALAMYFGYVYTLLEREGNLLLLGGWVSLGAPLSPPLAMLVTILLAAVIGLALHWLVFRRLRGASPLVSTVASVGVLIVFQAIIVLSVGAQSVPVAPVLPLTSWRLGGIQIPVAPSLLVLMTVLVTVLLSVLFTYTKFGMRTRAAAENEKAAILLGYSPNRLAAVNWMMSSVVIAVIGIFAATLGGAMDNMTFLLLIVPALGAALLGGMTSFWWTLLAGLGIGVLQSVVVYLSTLDWFPRGSDGSPLPGIKEALPFLIIVLALFVRGASLPSRGSLASIRMPFSPRPPRPARAVGAGVVVAVVLMLTLGPDWRLALINTTVGVALCLSLVILTGFVGQISLAQMALAGVAGFAMSKFLVGLGIGFPLAPLLGALVATLFGIVAAIPALRVRGVTLAIVTMAAALAIENFVFKNPTLGGGVQGAPVPSPTFLGLDFGPSTAASFGDGKLPNPVFGVFCIAIVGLLALAAANLRRSGTGRRMLAVRSNELAASAAGIDVPKTKLAAFAVAAFVAGCAGVLSGYRFGSVTPEYFGGLASITLLAFAVLGGISRIGGAVVGGLIIQGGLIVHFFLRLGVPEHLITLIGGIGLVATAVLHPDGIAGVPRQIRRALGRRRPGPAEPAQLVGAGESVKERA
ncbi:MAG TPA: ABC transporter permease [Amycolatopsis sp.]|nr:ABC transporter permease [Amycolatopsis sp.]